MNNNKLALVQSRAPHAGRQGLHSFGGSPLQSHVANWPLTFCNSCVQTRGGTSARCRRHQGGDGYSPAITSLAAA